MQGKLSPTDIGLYETTKKLNLIAYWLDLPVELEHIHNVLHVLQLMKYILDPNHVLVITSAEVTKDLTYKEYPIQILDCRIKQLHNKQTPLTKVV